MQKIKSFKEFLISIFVELPLQILFIFAGLIYLAYVFIGIGIVTLFALYMGDILSLEKSFITSFMYLQPCSDSCN